jgi:hypothetical protein
MLACSFFKIIKFLSTVQPRLEKVEFQGVAGKGATLACNTLKFIRFQLA